MRVRIILEDARRKMESQGDTAAGKHDMIPRVDGENRTRLEHTDEKGDACHRT